MEVIVFFFLKINIAKSKDIFRVSKDFAEAHGDPAALENSTRLAWYHAILKGWDDVKKMTIN